MCGNDSNSTGSGCGSSGNGGGCGCGSSECGSCNLGSLDEQIKAAELQLASLKEQKKSEK